MLNAYIRAVEKCGSYDQGNSLSEILPNIDRLSDQQVGRLIVAFNDNGQVRDSFGINGKYPGLYGDGLAYHLRRITGGAYEIKNDRLVEVGDFVVEPDSDDTSF